MAYSDTDISKYADEHDLVVVTKGSDFLNSHLINKTPKKLIRVVLGNISNAELLELFTTHIHAILSLNGRTEFYVEVSKEQLTVID